VALQNDRFIKEVCVALHLMEGTPQISVERLELAARWACGNSEFSFSKVQFSPLRPILETLDGRNKTKSGVIEKWFQPNVLSLKDSYFPDTAKPVLEQIKDRGSALKIALNTPAVDLLTTLQVHGSTVAITPDITDLPLYDFVKTTAAILHCLENGNGKLRLAGGSISGIQSYLYDIVSKRAGKLLKGRSFYLQLLSDSLVQELLGKFDLSDFHIVYSSGGSFFVIMGDEPTVMDRFEDFKSDVTKKLYAKHKTTLNCEFGISDAFGPNDRIEGKHGVWDNLIKLLNKAKTQRLSHNSTLIADLMGYVDEGGDDFNDPYSIFTRDIVTNEQILRVEAVEFDEDRNLVHQDTNAQKLLGETLRDAEFITSSKRSIHNDCFVDPLGMYHLVEKQPTSKNKTDTRVFKINPDVFDAPFMLYGGNKIPIFKNDEVGDDGEIYRAGAPKTFDMLAKGDQLQKLGILRMDVDNLGSIFSDKMGAYPSFARYSAVSRALDWFFKGYLNTIHKNYSDRTIVIYSGGDDLFIVGRWLEALEIACVIQEKFSKWAGGNLTISGGLAILPAKFPVMHGAELAGENEKLAKSYTLNGRKEKNAFVFFDRPLNWDYDMPIIQSLKKQLNWLLDKNGGKVHKSILSKIDMHAEGRKQQEKTKSSPKWIYNLIYDFGQFVEKTKIEKAKDEIRKLAVQSTLDDSEYRQGKRAVPFLFLLQTAARWVELETRTIKEKSILEIEHDHD
jgi:CRISPR-associated protein Csm1